MVDLRGVLRKKVKIGKKRISYPKFFIREPIHFIILPSLKKKEKINVKYPLLEPLASTNIYWDNKKKELIYYVVEPKLSQKDKELLNRIKSELTELIDVELSAIEKEHETMKYLESKIQKVLEDSGITLSPELYVKIMYYIFRDFVGLNEIEPLMHDPYIEDVGVDGLNVPIYVIHRKFGSMETNIVYKDPEYLGGFVIKLAERCGRYVSYAKPLLDGSLPDGSRVQASLAKDVTTKGPTFSIRKFRKHPLSPVEMINLGSASPELMAYLWIIAQSSTSMLICGGVSTGKTSFLNSITMFIPMESKIVSIEDTRELNLPHENWIPSVARIGFGVPEATGMRYGEVTLFELLKESFRQNPDHVIVGEIRGKEAYVLFQGMASIPEGEKVLILNDNTLKRIPIEDVDTKKGFKLPTINLETKKVRFASFSKIKHSPRSELFKIITKSGREIIATPDHSIFTYTNNKIEPIPTSQLRENDKIIIPSKLPSGYNNIEYLNLLEILPDLRVFAPQYIKKSVEVLGFEKASSIVGVSSISDYYFNFKRQKPAAMKFEKFIKLMEAAKIDFNINEIIVRYDKKSESFPAELKVTPEFLRLLGYIISEGSLYKGKKSYIINLYSKSKECLKDIENCIKKVTGKKPRKRVTYGFGSSIELSFSHKVLFNLLTKLCGKNSSERKIPNFIFGLSKERIGEFLSALYTGDGTLNKNYFGYYTISHDLANDLTTLLLTYGIVAKIRKRKRVNRKTIDYEVVFYTNEEKNEFLKFVKPIKKIPKITEIKVNQNKIGDLYVDKIKNIERIRLRKPVPVYDFSVQNTQNFISSSGILLHNSGHPSMGTIHAGSIDDVIKRLETPPIELSPSLVESLGLLVVMVHAKERGESARRVKEIVEIQSVDIHTGKAHTLKTFSWIPFSDKFESDVRDSPVLRKIAYEKGMPYPKLIEELENRKNVLAWMQRHDISRYDEVCSMINLYYKDKETILRWVANDVPPYKARGRIKKLTESVTGLKLIKE